MTDDKSERKHVIGPDVDVSIPLDDSPSPPASGQHCRIGSWPDDETEPEMTPEEVAAFKAALLKRKGLTPREPS